MMSIRWFKWFLLGALARALMLLGCVGVSTGMILILHDQTLIRKQPKQVCLVLIIGGLGCVVASVEIRGDEK
jgi:uncharacterized membrane protein YqjE